MFVYVKSEPTLWTVGHYNQHGRWVSNSDWGSNEEAAAYCSYLNGGAKPGFVAAMEHEALKPKPEIDRSFAAMVPNMTSGDLYVFLLLVEKLLSTRVAEAAPYHDVGQLSSLPGMASNLWDVISHMVIIEKKPHIGVDILHELHANGFVKSIIDGLGEDMNKW
jgi:hypothetical protein